MHFTDCNYYSIAAHEYSYFETVSGIVYIIVNVESGI